MSNNYEANSFEIKFFLLISSSEPSGLYVLFFPRSFGITLIIKYIIIVFLVVKHLKFQL